MRVVKGGGAGPVALMKLPEGDRLVAAQIAAGDHLLVVHENGMGKLVPLSEYPTKGRGGGGVASAAPDKPAKAPAGPVAGAWTVKEEGNVLIGQDGSREDLEVSTLPQGMRATVSKEMLDSVPALLMDNE